ncbi:MAG: dienelactone hydrolase family protein [Planctomycetes bacterium]|nr:dienelactone hydrolase family protein [Planctomycetota bacterium]
MRELAECSLHETSAAQALQAGKSGAQAKKPPATRVLDDPDIQHGNITFTRGKEEIAGHLARPKIDGKHPAVLVIAGNRIGEEYIPNTCAALAKAGFVGLAPNIYHPIPENISPDSASKEWKQAFAKRALDDMQIMKAAADYLMAAEFVQAGQLGIVGFCRGGKLALLFAAKEDKIKAVVPFHPGPTTAEEIAGLKAPVQIHHGTADRAVSHTKSLELEKILRKQSTPVEVFLYEKLDHGFLAYTRPFYNADAAKLAWIRTVEFLGKELKK